MTAILAIVICLGPLVWLILDGRRHQKRIDRFRQRSHVRIIQLPYDQDRERAA